MNSHYPWPEYTAYSLANVGRYPEQTFYHATPHYANEQLNAYTSKPMTTAVGCNNSRYVVGSNYPRFAIDFNNPRSGTDSINHRTANSFNNPRAAVSSDNPRTAVNSDNPRPRKTRGMRSKYHKNNFDARMGQRYHSYSHQGFNQSYSGQATFAQVVPDFCSPYSGIYRRGVGESSSVKNPPLQNIEQIYTSTSYNRRQDPVNLVKCENFVETEAENSSLPNNCKKENFLGGISSAPILNGTIRNLPNEKFGPTDGKNTITNTKYSENMEIQLTQPVKNAGLDLVVDPNLNFSPVFTHMENKTDQISDVINANESLLNGDDMIDFKSLIDNSDNIAFENNDFLFANSEANEQLIEDPNTDQLVDELIRIAFEFEQSSKSGEFEKLLTTSKQQDINQPENKIAGLEDLDILEDPFLSILDSEKLDALLATCVEPISVLKGEAICEDFSSEDKNVQINMHDTNAISISTNDSLTHDLNGKSISILNSKAQQTDFPVYVDAQTQVTEKDFGKECEQVATRYDKSPQREISNLEDLQCKNADEMPKSGPLSALGFKQSKDHIQTTSSSSIESECKDLQSKNDYRMKRNPKRGRHSALEFIQFKDHIANTSSSSIESVCEDLRSKNDDGVQRMSKRVRHSTLGFKQSKHHITNTSSSSIESVCKDLQSKNDVGRKRKPKISRHSALELIQFKDPIQTTSSSSIDSVCEDLQSKNDDGLKERPKRGSHSTFECKQSRDNIQITPPSSIEYKFGQINASKNNLQLTTEKDLEETPRALRKSKRLNKN
ncbi:hypothetical protein JTE90_015229 [Oedothorax gibbosus]|uniref:Exophilin 5 n=1 Tax=Oedothorax gibbosus TaxID=931172 RepID=A0AAV6VAC9_9ARAC|nr:hypothetical protein JTE90_015229 [Oedothorax gibbosus]